MATERFATEAREEFAAEAPERFGTEAPEAFAAEAPDAFAAEAPEAFATEALDASATEYTEYTEREVGASAEPPLESAGPVSAAEARLGAEGLARLRGRYAEVMARISDRQLDEETREQLKQRAERLNPDTWVTADEVAQALEVYESVYEGLRALVGTRHRRRRGRGRRPEGGAEGQNG